MLVEPGVGGFGVFGCGAVREVLVEEISNFAHVFLAHWVAIKCGIASGDVVFELAFDIGEEGRCADPEQMWGEPVVAEFVFHKHEVFGGLFGGADPSGGFEPDFDSRALVVFADEAGHDEGEGEGGVDGFFSG